MCTCVDASGRLLGWQVALSRPWPMFQKEAAPTVAEAAPGRPVTELQQEVPDVVLPSEALKDTAPILQGVQVSGARARPGGSRHRAEQQGEGRLPVTGAPGPVCSELSAQRQTYPISWG